MAPDTPVVDDSPVDAAAVERAAVRLTGALAPTDLQFNERLSRLTGYDVWFKREDLQHARSYKVRGAYHLISRLSRTQREAGVVCASAGNHAQGVAHACRVLGVRARIVLPRTTPRQKRQRVAAIGGAWVEVVIEGDYYDESAAAAVAAAERAGSVLVPPFDHPDVIAGQGTIGPEMVSQLGGTPDAVIAPVGGGGLLAGIATWMAERHPDVRIFGAEPAGAASLTAALAQGGPSTLTSVDTFVDGASVARVGNLTYALIAPRMEQVRVVAEGLICTEMIDLYQEDGIVAEPAGALAGAALRDGLELPTGSRVVCILSGGNNDLSRYAEVVERSLVHQGRKHYFMVDFPQEAGSLRRFLDEVLGPDDDITLFEYVKRSNREVGPALVGIELGQPGDLDGLLGRMALSPVRATHLPADSQITRFLV